MRLLVTGASSGIGLALCRQMAGEAKVFAMARRADLLTQLAEETGATPVPGDVSLYEDCERLVQAAAGEGELALVNCAGVARFGSFHQSEWSDLRNQVEVNLFGTMAACHAAIPAMLAAGGGQIVNVLSITATHVFSGSTAYSAAKAGGLQFTRILNAEYRRQGIRCMAVIPGAVDTPIWDGQAFVPPKQDMIPVDDIAREIANLLRMPRSLSVDEVTIMPQRGIL